MIVFVFFLFEKVHLKIHRRQIHTKLLSVYRVPTVLLDFSITVKAATLIFLSGCGSAISSAKEGKSGFIYNLVKS